MDDLLRTGLRVLFAYVVLHQLFRHAGHRVVACGAGGVGAGNGIDLLVALIVGDLIDDLLWAEVPAIQFIVAAGTIVLLHILVELVRYADTGWRGRLEGTPASLLNSGKLERAKMRAERINEGEISALLRSNGIDRASWPEIRAGYLENSGKLSLLLHPWAKPAVYADRGRVRRGERSD